VTDGLLNFDKHLFNHMFTLLTQLDVTCLFRRVQVVLVRTNITGFRDTLCDTQPISKLTESDEIFAVEVPSVCSSDRVTAVVVNIDTSSSLRCALHQTAML